MNKLKNLLNGNNKILVFFIFLILGTAIYSPFINYNYTYDDFLFISVMEEKIPYNPLLGFWAADMQDFEAFNSMWWADSDAEGTFFRPIPTFVVSSAFNIWGRDSALPLHLFSIILHCINSFLVFLTLNKISKNPAVSLTAGFIYLICVHHVINVGWIATNTDLLAVFFMMLSIYCYILFRENNKKLYLLYSLIFQLLAFGCKETASITTAAIILYEFLIVPDDSRIKTLFSNWKFWTGSTLLTLCFLIFYKLAGFGINSLLYYDPFLHPLDFIKNLFIGYPMMFLGLLSVAPISFPVFMPELTAPYLIGGIVLTLIFLIIIYKYRKDKIILFCFFLFIISILPQLSADATERQLYFPFAVGSYMISFLIFQIPFLKKRLNKLENVTENETIPSTLEWVRVGFSYYLLLSSVILSFILAVYYPYSFSSSAARPQEHTLQIKALADKKNAEKIILLNIQSTMDLLYINEIYRYYSGKYIDLHILYGGGGRLWFKKGSDGSIYLKTDKKGWLTNMFAKLPRTNPVIENNKYYYKKDFNVNIIQTTPDKEDVLEARFKFYSPPEKYIIIYFDGNELKEMDINSVKPDEWIFIGDTSDVLKNMM